MSQHRQNRTTSPVPIDLLCIGIAVYDLVLTLDHHPAPDEKTTASAFIGCGGGTAANGAVVAARLGHSAALATYLGTDLYGEQHFVELQAAGVETSLVVRGEQTTPFSVVLVKPNGDRALVNYRGAMPELTPADLDLRGWAPRAILLDGHHRELALWAVEWARTWGIPTVLDADRVHEGSLALAERVDYLVASEHFAHDISDGADPEKAAYQLLDLAPNVVITLGARGLVWRTHRQAGRVPAFAVDAVDTTGAGDAFHGAFAAGLAAGYAWDDLLAYASAAGALCTTVMGARPGLPTRTELERFLAQQRET